MLVCFILEYNWEGTNWMQVDAAAWAASRCSIKDNTSKAKLVGRGLVCEEQMVARSRVSNNSLLESEPTLDVFFFPSFSLQLYSATISDPPLLLLPIYFSCKLLLLVYLSVLRCRRFCFCQNLPGRATINRLSWALDFFKLKLRRQWMNWNSNLLVSVARARKKVEKVRVRVRKDKVLSVSLQQERQVDWEYSLFKGENGKEFKSLFVCQWEESCWIWNEFCDSDNSW